MDTPPIPGPTPRRTAGGIALGLAAIAALLLGLALRGPGALGLVVLFLVFIPLEKLFALRPQRVFRRGFVTDLTHLLLTNLLVGVAVVGFVVVAALPLIWVRQFDVAGALPPAISVTLAVLIVLIGSYWGHRLTH